MPWHLAVADNDSQDGTVETLRRLAPDATVVPMGRNAGYAAGINAAVAAVGQPGRATLVLNPDVRLGPGCVPELLRALDEDGVGIAVPRLVDGCGELIRSMRREPTVLRAAADAVIGARRAGRFPLLGELVTDLQCYERPSTSDWAEGSTQLVSAECVGRLLAVGRELLPLLGGDRVPPAGPRPRVRDPVRADGRRHPPRG